MRCVETLGEHQLSDEDASKIRLALRNYLRGIAHASVPTVSAAYRTLKRYGKQAVPVIEQNIHGSEWGSVTNQTQVRYLAALLRLLEEIDGETLSKAVSTLRSKKLHQTYEQVLKLIEYKNRDKLHTVHAFGIEIYISRKIEKFDLVEQYVVKWLGTPDANDISEITRIDIIPYQNSYDYAGLYSLYFSEIVLTWERRWRTWPKRLIRLLFSEFTLYHEVGHHALSRVEGGSQPDQEREANQYAAKMLMKAHWFIAAMAAPVRLIRSLTRARRD